MAKKFGVAIDMQKLEVQNQRVHNLASAPGSPVEGQLYYDTVTKKLYYRNDSTWVDTSSASVTYATTADLADVDGAAESAGVATTVPRGDHKHALSMATTANLADVDGAAEAAGTSNTAARGDHKHLLTLGNVTAQTSFGASSANGTATSASRSDHVHGTPVHDDAAHNTVELNDLAAPDGDVAFGGFKITGLATPTAATDGATKAYVDSVATGLDAKQSVRAATTANGTLATAFANGQVIDGITLATNDRILIKNQSAPAENGIYFVNAAGAPTRALDSDTWVELISAFTWVEQGTVNADTGWVSTVDQGGTLNTTAVTFVQFTGAAQITAGTGLTKTGNTLDVIAGTGMVANADDVAVLRTDTNGRVPLKFALTIGDTSATSFNIDHNLNSLDVIVQVYKVSDGVEYEVDVTRSTVNRVIVAFATAPGTNEFRVVCYG